ncbi:MATE family efflux transporter [Clostridium butyricum]|uniref:MATE family efflux transporter n=1 Tax=Clostridium butyricum TaxID=1492 RepID=UPI00374F709E
MKKRDYSLTEGVIWKSLLFFAVPIMLSNLLQQLYSAVDSSIVGIFAGSMPLAAVGSSGALINLLVGFFLGISTGTSVIFAKYFGADDKKKLLKTMNTSIILSSIAGIIITIVGMIWTKSLLEFMHCPEDVIDLSVMYLRVYFLGIVGMMIYNVGAGIIRARGDSKHPLYYLFVSGVLNLVLDILFVAVFNMGVAGAAFATVISQYVSAALVIINLMNIPESYRLRLKKIHFDKETANEIIRLGIPCGLQAAMFNISNMLVQIKINDFGSIAMAGCAAYEKIDSFLYVPMMAFGLAISTFVGQNIGAGKTDRIKKGVKVCLGYAVIITFMMSILVLLSGSYLINLFTTSEEVKNMGLVMMYIIAPFTFTHCFTEVLAGAIRGAGFAFHTMILTATGICLFRVIWLSSMLSYMNDIRLLYWCYPASWIFCSICFIIYYLRGRWLTNSLQSEY